MWQYALAMLDVLLELTGDQRLLSKERIDMMKGMVKVSLHCACLAHMLFGLLGYKNKIKLNDAMVPSKPLYCASGMYINY